MDRSTDSAASMIMRPRLTVFYTPMRAAHFIKNTEQSIENTEPDDGRSPETDKNSHTLVIGARSEDKEIYGEQN